MMCWPLMMLYLALGTASTDQANCSNEEAALLARKAKAKKVGCPAQPTLTCPTGCGQCDASYCCDPGVSCSGGKCSATGVVCAPGCTGGSGSGSDSCYAVKTCPSFCSGIQPPNTVCAYNFENSGDQECKYLTCPLGGLLIDYNSGFAVPADGCSSKKFYQAGRARGQLPGGCPSPTYPLPECLEPQGRSVAYPDFLKDPEVNHLESLSCVVACACNDVGSGLYLGPPNGCKTIGEVAGSPATCCMCINDQVLVTSEENANKIRQAGEQAFESAGFEPDTFWTLALRDKCGNYYSVLNPNAPGSCAQKVLPSGLIVRQ